MKRILFDWNLNLRSLPNCSSQPSLAYGVLSLSLLYNHYTASQLLTFLLLQSSSSKANSNSQIGAQLITHIDLSDRRTIRAMKGLEIRLRF